MPITSQLCITQQRRLQDAEDIETDEEEDSQADGFVVDDGYLSEGEGAPIDNDDFGAEVEGTRFFIAIYCSICIRGISTTGDAPKTMDAIA